MKPSGFTLKTKNLILVPADDSRLWTKPWYINKRDTGTNVGRVAFKGNPENYAVEIEINIKSDFRGRDYDSEALEIISNWALGKDKVFFVEAYAYVDDRPAITALTHAKFVEDENIGKKTRYIRRRDKMPWLIITMSMFLSGGFAIGFTIHSVVQGLIIGACMGLFFGIFMNIRGKKRIEVAEKEWRDSKIKHRKR
ncbi:MAG: hypothetical protein Q4C80_07080 [Bacillota bacterium]|nr:hypothetical protein [Bacillota bacterium]